MVDLVVRPIRARSSARTALLALALAPALTLTTAGIAAAAERPVPLGTAAAFEVLAGSGITNTGRSVITGDVGSSPTRSETGFTPCPAANCVELTGTDHGNDPTDAVTLQAKLDLTTGFLDAASRTGGTAVSAPLGGGQTLVPGLYSSATDLFVGGDLTLDAGGDPDAVFIFQARTGTLVTAAGTTGGVPNTRVLLTGGAQACNVIWQVGSSATISTATQFAGSILAGQSITANTGATVDSGRLLAQDGAVTLDTNTLRRADCATPTTPGTPTTTATTPAPSTPPTTGTTPAPSTTPAPATTTGTTPETAPTAGTPTTATTPATSVPAGTPSTPAAATSTGVTPTSTPAATPGASGTSTPTTSTPASDAPTAGASPAAPMGTARIVGPGGTVAGPFAVTVTGTRIAQVVFRVDGRRVGTVTAAPGRTRFRIRLRPRAGDHRVHRVTARVRFRAGSRRRQTTLRLTYRGPVTPRGPQFAG